MMTHSEENIQIAKLQKEIESFIGINTNSIVYNYSEQDGKVKLDVITINERHNQSFLFHTVTDYDKVGALEKMLKYAKTYKERELSFTIQWSLIGVDELHTSYFRAKNILDAIDKLLYGREPNSVNIFSVVMNPLS